jgi:hypothetical protein
MKSKKDVVRGVIKPTSISPKSSFTDPNEPWSAKANVAENVTTKRSELLKRFYKAKGWNVDYISKNKKVGQSKTGDYEKWKRDHGIFEEDQIDEVRMSAAVKLSRAWDRQRAKSDASERRTPSSIPKKEEPKKQGVMEMDKSEPSGGRDGPRMPGPDKEAKIISAKKFKNHALSILQKSLQAKDKKKNMKEAKDAGEYDYEGAMAKTQLQTICRNAEALKDMLDDDENLPEWVQAKITKAEDYITTSLDYLKSTDELEEEISLDEALSKNAKAYDWIHDFVHSDNPKFDGKSKAQRMQMALAAYYASQKRSRTKNEGVGDPQAATQSPADGANGGEELAPPKKSIKKVVKEFYSASRQVQEDLYDWEKDDKAAKPYGKKPTVQKIDGVNNIGDDKPNAKLILKGGKTLTGEPRDTVEIDPMMKNRTKMPDYKSMDKIKQKPQEQ